MKFILGQKKNMTQIFKNDGAVIPVTVVEAKPNIITQVKTSDKDGYFAVQVGSGVTKKSHKKPQLGHLKGLKTSRWLKESKLPSPLDKLKRGLEFGVEIFKAGDKVRVTGVSKGKGFQGVVKRHGFHGAPKTHGTKDQLRMPGSIGATGPAHVFKGRKMPGRMGGDKTTVTGLEIVKVDKDKDLLYIKGAVPGSYNSLVMIQGPGIFKIKNKESGIKNHKEKQNKKKEFKEMLEELKQAGLPENEYAIFGSGSIIVRELRSDIHGLDVIVTDRLFEEKRKNSEWELKDGPDGSKYLSKGVVELWRDWSPGEWDIYRLIKEAEVIDGVKYVKLEEVLKWKKLNNRDKDKKDIELIEKYLKNQNQA